MAMNIQRKTSNIGNIVAYDASGNVTLPAGFTVTGLSTAGYVKTSALGAFSVSATIPGSDVTGAALTKTDDTNVTLTLGGTPATSLLRAASLTLGWTGQLAVGRGGTGAGTLTGVLIGNGTSAFTAITGTAGQLLRRNAGDTAYEFFTPTYLTANQSITLSGDVTGTGSTAITTTLANSGVTAGTYNNFVVDVKGRVTSATRTEWRVSRTIPTTVNDCVDIGTLSVGNGAHTYRISITNSDSGFSTAHVYDISSFYAATSGAWTIVAPISSSGAYSGNNIQLEALHNNNDLTLRIRRIAGATAGTAWVHIVNTGLSTITFTESTTVTAAAAVVSTYLPNNGLSQTAATLTYRGSNVWTAANLTNLNQLTNGPGYITGNQTITVSGDASGSGATAITLTLATVNSNIGTFNNVTVNAKGLVTAASNVSYLTGNQSITLSGDISGTGTTAITTTLATVTQSTGSSFVKITLDTKGRVTGNTAVSATDLNSTFGSQTANFFYAAPNGTAGNPSFRAIVAADIPTLNQNTTGSAGSVANAVTFTTTGGAAAGTTYNGSVARTIDYSTVGAAAASHTQAWSTITSTPTTISGYGITDAYTKSEVDSFLQGLDPKASVKAATTANITLSAPQTIDGISVIAGDRVLVKDQSTASQNGIYVVAAGAWTRATDMNLASEFAGAYVFVEQGTVNADRAYVCTNDTVTVDTTNITFVQFAGPGAYQSVLNGTGFVRMSGTSVSYVTGTSSQFVKADGTLDSTAYTTNTGTVTSVAIATGTTGTDINISGSPVTTSGTITINIPTASASARGLLSSTDWSTFNGKQAALNGTGFVRMAGTTVSYITGTASQFVKADGTLDSTAYTTNTGTVTSVALSLPAIFTVSGSPVTTSGTLTATLANQTANTVFAGPTTGVAAAPTFRSLVAADIPSLAYVTSVALSLPSIFTVSGSPVTSSGTLTATLASQTANTFFAAPNGTAGAPSFRTIVAADIPSLSYLPLSGGTLTGGLTGTTATFSGIIGFPGDTRYGISKTYTQATGDMYGIEQVSSTQTGGNPGLRLFTANAASAELVLGKYTSATAFTSFLTFSNAGAATFSSSVTAAGFTATGTGTVSIPIDTGNSKAYISALNITGPALTLVADSVGRTLRLSSDASGSIIGALDANTNGLYIGTNTGHPIIFLPAAVAKMQLGTSGQLRLHSYTATSSFTGTAVGVLAFDASGNILTIATPSGGGGTTLNGTGYVKMSGTTVSYVSSIPNADLANSSFNIGTTSISLGRASAAQTLTGVSIDGSAANVSASNLNTQQVTVALAAGSWYTIAANAGDRASAKFTVTDPTSGLHQAIHFYATAHFGTATGAKISVISNTYYAGPPVSGIRIMTGGTYDGAMVQIYAASACTVTVSIYDNQQTNGWVIKSGIISSTNPGTVAAFGSLTVTAAEVSLASGKSVTFTDDIYIGGYTSQYLALHANNYNSYAPSLTGAGASGTWGISVTGSASTAGKLSVTSISNVSTGRTAGYLEYYDAENATGGPASGWHSYISVRHGNASNQYGFQFANSFGTENLYWRGWDGTNPLTWRVILNDSNYSSYALPLSGGSLTGNINWGQTDRGLVWNFNTDGAYIKFYNTGNGDTDSRLEYGTYDDGNEYHRFLVSGSERFTIKANGIGVTGDRTIYLDSVNGAITIKGSAGGWATGTYFQGNGGTTHAGFGALGSANTFSYLWMGAAYNDPWVTVTSSETKVFGLLRVGNGSSSNIYMTDTDETTRIIHCNSNRIGFLNSSGSWSAYSDNSGNWFSDYSVRAPIFYDSQDTTFYWDGSAALSMVINGGAQLSGYNNTNAYLCFNNASTYWGIIGNYASNDWRIGYGNYSALQGWNLRWDASGNAWANASMRAPIFYDSDDTGYYLDPNSISNLSTVRAYSYEGNGNVGGTGAASWHPSGIYCGSTMWQYGEMYKNNTGINNVSQIYVNGWFRNNTNNTGLYSENTTQHWSSKDNGYWDASSTTTVSSIRFWTGGHVNTLRGYVYANSSNEIGFLNNAGSWIIRCVGTSNTYLTGSFTATGDVVAYSDARVKTNIQTITNALEKVTSMRGVTYNRIDVDDTSEKVGVIAQEIQQVLPQVVMEDDYGKLGVSYGNIVGVLIEAIKEQQVQIQDLKKQIEFLAENK